MENKNNKNTMLVPTDFSEVADHALEHAIQVAKKFDNNLAILHVAEEGLLGGIFGKNSYDNIVVEAIKGKLDLCIKKCNENGINATSYMKSGRIYKTIVSTCDELGCDAIIMGTHGASGLESIIGSNASRVISTSNVPVIVVKEESNSRANYANIVMPVDLSLESKQKVKWAIHLAKHYSSTIHLMSFHLNDEFLATHMSAQLNQVINMLTENHVSYTHKEVIGGNVADQVLRYAEEINSDLILIMGQQEKGFSEYLLGSQSQQIVNHSGKVPVMCVNPKEISMMGDYVG